MSLARVLVIEDDPFTRSLIQGVLSAANFAVRPADSASSALSTLIDFEPNVCLVDVDREKLPAVGIVFLTSFRDHRLSKAGDLPLPKGARYITKSALNQVQRLTTELLSASFKPMVADRTPLGRVPLTSHQIEIMRLVAQGLTNHQIALQQESTEKAVEHVIARILQKIGIQRDARLNPRVELVQAYAELSGRPVPR